MNTKIARVAPLWSVLALVFLAPIAAAAQGGQGGGRSGQPAPDPKPTGERVRVPTSHANVHMGSGSGDQILVLVRKETILPVLARRGEWIQVQLSPELRKTGIVMRWYKNETSGWMHDSTVELLKPGSK